jgi:hypothetical protein
VSMRLATPLAAVLLLALSASSRGIARDAGSGVSASKLRRPVSVTIDWHGTLSSRPGGLVPYNGVVYDNWEFAPADDPASGVCR